MPLDKIYPGISKTLSWIHWFQALCIGGRGLATIDRLLTVSLVVDKQGWKRGLWGGLKLLLKFEL